MLKISSFYYWKSKFPVIILPISNVIRKSVIYKSLFLSGFIFLYTSCGYC